MKKTGLVIVAFLMLLAQQSTAQYSRYIVKLKDKGTNPFSIGNPSQYLTTAAIERRTRYNIAIDSTDLPVTPRYIDSIRLAGNVQILNVSKWLNQVAIRTTDAAALTKINSFAFVISAAPIAARFADNNLPVNKNLDAAFTQGNSPAGSENFVESLYNYGKSNGQVKIHQGQFLHDHGFRGEGMKMTILDAGFYHYLSLPTFDSIRANNQILGTWDFVANEASVDEDFEHGMKCLSTIAANIPGVFVGTAPKTSFYLYRTEDVSSEYPIEEQNWVAGVERADSLGVPITSTSLGYYDFDGTIFDYTYADMNGNTTISARGADLAAKKGMLMVVAAGNTGNDIGWNHIITPSDADSVLAIAAVDTLGNVAGFSAYGPSSDGDVKPNIASVGWNAVVANSFNGQPEYGSGTSYACPNMAGLLTCLWQAFPEVNNMAIVDAVQRSSSKFATPDNRMGYGIPDMKKAFVTLIKKLYTKQFSIAPCATSLQFSIKTASDMSVELERKLAGETTYSSINTFTTTTAFSTNNFTYSDNLSAIATGDINYRLKMTIGTDTTFYVDSVTLQHTQTCGIPIDPTNEIIIGPNPVLDNLNIRISRVTAAKVDINITNALGQKVYAKSVQEPVGFTIESIPMKAMSRGVYFVSVFVDGKKVMTKQILK